jgi:hypothetical protein
MSEEDSCRELLVIPALPKLKLDHVQLWWFEEPRKVAEPPSTKSYHTTYNLN